MNNNDTQPLILTVKKAHKLLGGVIGIHKFYKIIKSGLIPSTIINNKITVKYEDIYNFVDSLFSQKIDTPFIKSFPLSNFKNNFLRGIHEKSKSTT